MLLSLLTSALCGDTASGRCALLFFGLVKQFPDIVLPSIRKHIIARNPDCDVFAHTYKLTATTNARNREFGDRIQWRNIAMLTNRTVFDTMASFSSARNLTEYRRHFPNGVSWHYPTSLDNMIKQWHSIERVWDLMTRSSSASRYERVGLFRSDVVYFTDVDIDAHDAAIPDFEHWWGMNDRMFYGRRKYAKVWAKTRFSQVGDFLHMHPSKGLHSETFMAFLMRGIPVQRVTICFHRVRAMGHVEPDGCSWGVPTPSPTTLPPWSIDTPPAPTTHSMRRKLAFLFQVGYTLPHANVWEAFFSTADPASFVIFVHPSSGQLDAALPWRFHQAVIPHTPSAWGFVSNVQIALVRSALVDGDVTHMVFVSETTVGRCFCVFLSTSLSHALPSPSLLSSDSCQIVCNCIPEHYKRQSFTAVPSVRPRVVCRR